MSRKLPAAIEAWLLQLDEEGLEKFLEAIEPVLAKGRAAQAQRRGEVEDQLCKILTDLAPREKEHSGVSAASESFIRILIPRLMTAFKNVNETAGNAGYNDTYFTFKAGESVVEAALMGMRGERLT